MNGGSARSGRDGFEPPKYLASLVASIDDGAKTAQAGALLFALAGVYLAAAAFSATDSDLLRGTALTISQIGASLPPSFSFAIAPIIFVFLHVYTLARYHMLAANVRQFQRPTESELSDFSSLWHDGCVGQSTRHKVWTKITRPKYERAGQRYASDLTDAEWAVIEPHMPAPKPLGRPGGEPLRDFRRRFCLSQAAMA
jgi:hypothetical protein